MIGYLILVFALCAVAQLLVRTLSDYEQPYSEGPLFAWGSTVTIVVLAAMLSPAGLSLTGGFWPGYSDGERVGYVTKLSRKGIIWKTWEAQIQVGTGEMAALQEPFAFSLGDNAALAHKLGEYAESGRRVRVTYSQWLVQPAWLGETPYRAEKVTPLKAEAGDGADG